MGSIVDMLTLGRGVASLNGSLEIKLGDEYCIQNSYSGHILLMAVIYFYLVALKFCSTIRGERNIYKVLHGECNCRFLFTPSLMI